VIDHPWISDTELDAEALAADPDAIIDEDAVSLWTINPRREVALLPEWYAPPPMARRQPLTGWRRRLAILTVMAFVAINAYGLCSTYGQIVLA